VKTRRLATPEPMGKLDTVTVNGPEDEIIDWDAVDWRRVEDDVRRLRQRIFTATQEGDLTRVRNLQKLSIPSHPHALPARLPDGPAGAPVLCSPD
jgi:RNA-directed DNA polymerase